MFWDEVQHSVWIGGKSDASPVYEDVPYWLNGIVPLAYQLGDDKLIGFVHKYFDYILSHQTDEGWMGPDNVKNGEMYWSKFPLLLAFKQVRAVVEFVETINFVCIKLKCVLTGVGRIWGESLLFSATYTCTVSHQSFQKRPGMGYLPAVIIKLSD